LTRAVSSPTMRPQHDCPVAAWHPYAHAAPDHAARSTRTLQAHMVNLSNMGKASGRFRRGGRWVKVSTPRTAAKEGAFRGSGRGPRPLESGVCANRAPKGVRKRVAHGAARMLVNLTQRGRRQDAGFTHAPRGSSVWAKRQRHPWSE